MIPQYLPAAAAGLMLGLVAVALLPRPQPEAGTFAGLMAELEAREAVIAARARD